MKKLALSAHVAMAYAMMWPHRSAEAVVLDMPDTFMSRGDVEEYLGKPTAEDMRRLGEEMKALDYSKLEARITAEDDAAPEPEPIPQYIKRNKKRCKAARQARKTTARTR